MDHKRKIERTIRVHLGYGEYVELDISKIFQSYYTSILETSWGYAILPTYTINNSFLPSNVNLIFLNDGVCYYGLVEGEGSLYNWYDGSVLLRKSDRTKEKYTVYSPKGEVILKRDQVDNDPFNTGTYPVTPIAYDSYLTRSLSSYSNSIFIQRFNLDSDWYPALWTATIENIPSDARIEWKPEILNGANCLYELEYTEYDGKKTTLKFSLNIETGELTYL